MNDKLKTYRGKNRIYISVPKAPRISRRWVWDLERSEYLPPPNGKSYFARRYKHGLREYRFLVSLEEARAWQMGEETSNSIEEGVKKRASGPRFGEVAKEWKRRRYPHLAIGTQLQYDKLIKLYLKSLFEIPIREMTSQRINCWLDELKSPVALSMKRVTRKSFEHELTLLNTIFRYYQEYHDDPDFRFPVKRRHWEGVHLHQSRSLETKKDLREEEFLAFIEHLKTHKDGELMARLASVQYYQALRISEAAALFWEDVQFDWTHPEKSRIKIVRSLFFSRTKEEGFPIPEPM